MNQDENLTEHTVAIYDSHDQAEAAVKLLSSSGYDLRNLSIVGKNYSSDEHPVGFVNTGDRMWTWGKFGAFWGTIWGLLFGSAMVFIPGVGPVLFAGWIVAAIEGAIIGGGLGALGGFLASVGVPENSVVKYETALKAGSFLLIVHGSESEVQKAKSDLANTQATSVDSFSTKKTPAVR